MKQPIDIHKCPCCDHSFEAVGGDRYCKNCNTLLTPSIDPNIYGLDYFLRYIKYNRSELNAKIQTIRWDTVQRHHLGGKLLDIGCAVGSFIKESPKKYVSEGYDINPFCLDHCRSKGMSVHSELPKDHRYDVITMFDVLEHIPNLEDFIQQIYSMLKLNGIWVVTVPNFHHGRLENIKTWTHYKPQEHVYYLSGDSIRAICDKFALSLIGIHYNESQYRPPKDNIATYVMRKSWKKSGH